MKVIMCGYNWAGCSALDQLINKNHEVYVYTHKTRNSVADLEGLCIKKRVDYTTERINVTNIPFTPDIICSIYYRYLFDKSIIDLSDGKIFNLHPSLLPDYRGCSSITWAMINGEKYCGYTWHYIDEGCDTGNIIIQKKIKIEEYDTQLTLYNRVMFEAMRDFQAAFDRVIHGDCGEQQIGKGRYYKRGCPKAGIIDYDTMTEDEIERFIRAMVYPPYKSAQVDGKFVETYCDYLSYRKQRAGACVLNSEDIGTN